MNTLGDPRRRVFENIRKENPGCQFAEATSLTANSKKLIYDSEILRDTRRSSKSSKGLTNCQGLDDDHTINGIFMYIRIVSKHWKP